MRCNFLHKSKKSQRCQPPKKQHYFKGKRQKEKRKENLIVVFWLIIWYHSLMRQLYVEGMSETWER